MAVEVAEAASLITERSGMLEVKEVRENTDTVRHLKSSFSKRLKSAEMRKYQHLSNIYCMYVCICMSRDLSLRDPFRPFCGTEVLVRPQQ